MTHRWRWPCLTLLVLVGAIPQLGLAASSPLVWSSDGAWVSYVVESPVAEEPLRTDWIFEAPVDTPPISLDKKPLMNPLPMVSRLWATKVGSKTSILLEESTGPIGPPGWSPDGHSIAFGRVSTKAPGRGLYEIIRVEGTSRLVLFSQAIEDWGHEADQVARVPLSWSPDGRLLAIPQLKPSGLAILRVDTGRVIKTIEGATLPAWAPDGSKLLFVTTSDQDHLESLDSHFGASRHLANMGQLDGPPIFARDGLSAIVLSRKRIERGAAPPAEQVDLSRVRLDDGHVDRITTLGTTAKDQIVSATSLTQDRDGENIYAAMTVTGLPSQVTWFRPRERSVHKKFPILDQNFRIENLSLSPSKETLAVRLVTSDLRSLPILCDVDTMQFTPLVPDASTRNSWTACLLNSIESLLAELRPVAIVGGRAIDRPVALPIPGESDMNRVRRLGRFGHDLIETGKPEGGNQAAFLFDYLRADYPAAMAGLDSLETHENSPGRRLRMLNLRAQVAVGMGDYDQARGTLNYLKSIEPSRKRRILETTSQGVVLTDITSSEVGWPDYAKDRVAAIEREASQNEAAETNSLTEHRNPDAPQPGLGLELDPLPPPRPGFPLAPLPEFIKKPRFPALPNQPFKPDGPKF